MALAEIEIALEIVIIGFTTIFITLAVLAVVFAVVGGKSYMNKFFNNV
jgi:hypothetical protein